MGSPRGVRIRGCRCTRRGACASTAVSLVSATARWQRRNSIARQSARRGRGLDGGRKRRAIECMQGSTLAWRHRAVREPGGGPALGCRARLLANPGLRTAQRLDADVAADLQLVAAFDQPGLGAVGLALGRVEDGAVAPGLLAVRLEVDRKSTRLNSSH